MIASRHLRAYLASLPSSTRFPGRVQPAGVELTQRHLRIEPGDRLFVAGLTFEHATSRRFIPEQAVGRRPAPDCGIAVGHERRDRPAPLLRRAQVKMKNLESLGQPIPPPGPTTSLDARFVHLQQNSPVLIRQPRLVHGRTLPANTSHSPEQHPARGEKSLDLPCRLDKCREWRSGTRSRSIS